jgi:hypothetical protein
LIISKCNFMKKFFLPFSFLTVILLTGCMKSRYITEKYIKTNIETHIEGEFSNVSTYTIFQGIVNGGGAYLELTGYKYKDKKALVIGADRYYVARDKLNGYQTAIAEITYIELSIDQCNSIINNYKILQDKIKAEKPKKSEEIYHDFTVSKDLFICYKKSAGSSSVSFLDFWIKGHKYKVSTKLIIKKLKKFMEY